MTKKKKSCDSPTKIKKEGYVVYPRFYKQCDWILWDDLLLLFSCFYASHEHAVILSF